MKFIVSRTSVGLLNRPPCKGASRETCSVLQEYFWTNFEAYQKSYGVPFVAKGRDHRCESSGISRIVDEERWTMEIPDLIAFAREHGPIVLTPAPEGLLWEVEIYDERRDD